MHSKRRPRATAAAAGAMTRAATGAISAMAVIGTGIGAAAPAAALTAIAPDRAAKANGRTIPVAMAIANRAAMANRVAMAGRARNSIANRGAPRRPVNDPQLLHGGIRRGRADSRHVVGPARD